ncbi:MAG: hypothetical protein AVDCRST_MAG88-4180, partial [uncultured Thermomicrobiales bacterium]
ATYSHHPLVDRSAGASCRPGRRPDSNRQFARQRGEEPGQGNDGAAGDRLADRPTGRAHQPDQHRIDRRRPGARFGRRAPGPRRRGVEEGV